MTCGPGPGKLKRITFGPGPALASSMACRRVPGPESPVLVATISCGITRTTKEQALVFPPASRATQVTTVLPAGKLAPDAGEQTTSTSASQLSPTIGEAKVTTAAPESDGFSEVMISAGQTIDGGVTSWTRIVWSQDVWLPQASVA